MSHPAKVILIAVFALSSTIGLLADVGNAETLRTWTSTAGTTMEGQYEGQFGSEVKLRTSNRVLWVKLSALSQADRVWIEKYEAAKEEAAKEVVDEKEENQDRADDASAPEVKRTELPVLEGGDWHGYHAGYSAKKYDAYLDANGELWVHPKEHGERVGKGPIRVHLDCFARGEGSPYRGISVKGYRKVPRPEERASTIKLEMVLDRDVPFSISYHFTDDGIRIEGVGEEPRAVSPPTIYRIRARVPASHTWEDFDSGGGEQEVLKNWRIVTESVERERETFGYGDPAVMGGKLKEVRVDAPHYGERRISFEAGDPGSTWLVPAVSTEAFPWQGFSVQCTTGYNSERESDEFEFIIAIE